MNISAIQTTLFKPHENLAQFVVKHIPSAQEKTVLAVASKLFAYWKGEIIPYKSPAQK